jgi:hypothetical protein
MGNQLSDTLQFKINFQAGDVDIEIASLEHKAALIIAV